MPIPATNLAGENDRQPMSPQDSRTPISATALTRKTSLVLPPDIPLDEWSRIGKQVFSISNSSAWWLGDWLVYGQAQFPDRYRRAVEETSLDPQTLRNYAWVARRFSIHRRREGLSFQHHAELTSLSDEEQDKWMDRAVRLKWSRTELRKRVRATRQPSGQRNASQPTEAMKLQINVPKDRKQRWQSAAATYDQDLIDWMVSILDDVATGTLGSTSRPTPLRIAQ